jgi:3-hydroxyacyl-[acyl-carrier-protein] dehydratase
MLVYRADIEKYIPQRTPFVLIHELIEANDIRAVTKFVIEKECVLVEGGRLQEPGLIENIAQTAAAQIGYRCEQQSIPVPIGYIAAIKDLKIYGLPVIGAEIRTQIEVINLVLDITLIKGIVFLNDSVLCECEMRIFVKM